jgi:hypothetical protein
LILVAVGDRLVTPVAPARVDLPRGSYVNVDGMSEEPPVFVEVFAHQGALKGGQRHKIAGDVLKLVTLCKFYPTARLVIALASVDAARSLRNRSWLAEAVATWGIEVVVVDLPEAVIESLRVAQLRQVMINPKVGDRHPNS